jgi:hypothetical protein
VVSYLGRYTHRVGLSNHCLLHFDQEGVSFLTQNGSSVTLPPDEFIRRFLLHVLPKWAGRYGTGSALFLVKHLDFFARGGFLKDVDLLCYLRVPFLLIADQDLGSTFEQFAVCRLSVLRDAR